MRSVDRRIASAVSLVLLLANGLPPAALAKSSPWDAHMGAGRQQMAAGDYAEAAVSLEEALKDTARFQENDPRLGDTYYNLGELRLRQQEWGQAKQFFERALLMQQKSLPGDSLEIGDTLYGLATACEQLGNHQMAVILLKRVKSIWSAKYGAKDERLTQILPSMATYATLASDYKTAQDCYRQLVNIQEQTLGAGSPKLASSINLLAAALANTGNYSEAEPLAQRAVDILANAGSGSISLENAGLNLTYIQQQLGKKPTFIDHTDYRAPSLPAPTQIAEQATPTKVAVQTTPIKIAVQTAPVKVAVQPVPVKVAAQTAPIKVVVQPVPVKVAVQAAPTKVAVQAIPTKIAVQTEPIKPVVQIDESENTKIASKPVETKVVVKTVEARITGSSAKVAPIVETAQEKEPSKPVVVATLPSATADNQAKLVMRPPATAIVTTADDFRPWELASAAQAADAKRSQNNNYGKIRFLANGRLISPEEYKAMLLANEAYELIRSEKYTMAVEVLRRALAVYPDLASGHTNLGLAYSQLGDKTQALQELKQAIAIDPSRSAPWLNLASVFQLSGDLKASVATYSEYLKRFSNDPNSAKAKEIVAHLDRELKDQIDVERVLAATGGGKNDYFAYASHAGAARWPADHAVVKVYVAPGNVSGFKPEYAGFFADSFKQWSQASGNKIAFEMVKSADAADIDCLWTDDPTRVSSPEEGGETRVVRGGSGKINHATITVLTTGLSSDSPLSASQMRAVCLHEIGHALGICGHSPTPDDVMYCSIPGAHTKVGISSRDTATIQRLYAGDTIVSWLP